MNSKIGFLFALMILILSSLATLFDHLGVASNLILLSFIFLILATFFYLWEVKKNNED